MPAARSSVKPSYANDNLKDELIARTRQVWQPRLNRHLSREDALQIAENITGFFSVLADWSRAEMPSPANVLESPPPPTRGGVPQTLKPMPSAGTREAAAGPRYPPRMATATVVGKSTDG